MRVLGSAFLVVIALPCAACRHGTSAATKHSIAAHYVARDTSAATDSANIYFATRPNALSPAVLAAKPLVYVPNSRSNSVTEIDPATFHIVRTFKTGKLPQHIVPAHDLDRLYVANNNGNSLTPLDPVTGDPGRNIPVDDPYNLYLTPDGS